MIKLLCGCVKMTWKKLCCFMMKEKALITDRMQNYCKEAKGDFKALTPSDAIERGRESVRALEWALKKEGIYNVALTGKYGSGKSSVINTYIRKHPSTCYLQLSLASFMEADAEEPLKDIDEQSLEEGILKQLFYKANYKTIPQSRYRKLHRAQKKTIYISVLILLLLIWRMTAFFAPAIYEDGINYLNYLAEYHNISIAKAWIVTALCGAVIYGIASYLIWLLSSRYMVKDLNVFDKASISANQDQENSIFNKNMDEIMYFFEMTKYSVVFIEDLDRFKNIEIFVRLRELNILLNRNENINRRIVFVYAVQDDIFQNKDRTKFFDFIIPIIPVINSANSYEVLLKLVKENMLPMQISNDYMIKVSEYIDDMRILLNIFNEFLLYKYSLTREQGLNLTDEKIFSIIVYKNLDPKGFAELQDGKGIIVRAFEDKEVFQQRAESAFAEQIYNVTLEQLIREHGIRAVLSECVRENRFVTCMLKNGFIDESYVNYISYFYGVSICENDMNFVIGVRNHEKNDYWYTFYDVKAVIDKFAWFEFGEKEICNFEILEYLLENEADSIKCDRFIKQLQDGTAESKKFIDRFIRITRCIEIFIKEICKNYPAAWKELCIGESSAKMQKLIIAYAELEDLKNMDCYTDDGTGCINKFFCEHKDVLLSLRDVDQEKLKEIISLCNIKFKCLQCGGVSEALLYYIFDNNFYCMNPQMIREIVKLTSHKCVERLPKAHYTTILQTKYNPLIDRIHQNFTEYIRNVCLQEPDNVSEESDIVAQMLSRLVDEPELCETLIDKENILISDIEECCKGKVYMGKWNVKRIWGYLLKRRKMQLSVHNILSCYKVLGMSEELMDYLIEEEENVRNLPDAEMLPAELKERMQIRNIIEQ